MPILMKNKSGHRAWALPHSYIKADGLPIEQSQLPMTAITAIMTDPAGSLALDPALPGIIEILQDEETPQQH